MAAVKEKALCAQVPRVSHERRPQQGPLSPSCRPPCRVERNIPQEGICKGNICNHGSKAKWYLKMGEKKYRERRQNTAELHQGLRSERDKDLRLALHFPLGWLLPPSKQVLETRGSSTSAKRVPGSCLCLALLAVFPRRSRVPAGSTCG